MHRNMVQIWTSTPLLAKTEHYLKKLKDLVHEIKNIVLSDEENCISHDVVALFPSVPVNAGHKSFLTYTSYAQQKTALTHLLLTYLLWRARQDVAYREQLSKDGRWVHDLSGYILHSLLVWLTFPACTPRTVHLLQLFNSHYTEYLITLHFSTQLQYGPYIKDY